MPEKKAAPVLSGAAWEVGEQDGIWEGLGLNFSVSLASTWKTMRVPQSFRSTKKASSLAKQGKSCESGCLCCVFLGTT